MATNSQSSIHRINNWRLWICLFNLINQQPDIDKIYLYAKDPYEAKYQFLINNREGTGLKHFSDSKVLLNTQII